MLRRLLLIFLPSVTTSVSFADQDAWSCQQDKDSNEWVCLGDQSEATQQPADAEPVGTAAPIIVKPSEPQQNQTITAPVAAPRLPAEPIEEPRPVQAMPPEAVPVVTVPAPEVKRPQAAAPIEPDILDSFNVGLLNPMFDHEQEQIFTTLTSKLKVDPWENCTVQSAGKVAPADLREIRNKTPLDVKSNYSEIFDNEIGNYSGRVEMSRADQQALADKANYDSVSETLDLHGKVYYSEDQLALYSESASLKLATDQAKLRNTLFISAITPLRGSAEAVYRDSAFLSHYKKVTYTSCRPGNHDWAVHAAELKLNRQTGKGAAKNAWVEFKGVPVFYSPYLAFPVDNRRLSGFLSPTFGNTQNSGFNLSVPYYWNIAPNYDATLNPVYFGDRGLLLGGNFRYLTSNTQGQASVQYMPDDAKLNRSRHHLMLKHNTQFTEHLSTNLDLNTVSDNNYFAELGNALSTPNFSFLKSQGGISYIDEGVSFVTRVESYQTLDSSLKGNEIPYKRLPQINLNLNHAFNAVPIDAALESEAVNFQHSTLVDGQRLNVKPSLSLPLQTASSYVTPKISVQHTQYFLNNQQNGSSTDISRTLPIMSVDSGMYLERNIAGSALVQTLEPRLFYLYIPKTDQSQIPLFDTSIYDFWFASLFRENRFSGSDRIQDANQVSAAITSRLIDPATGRERLKLNVGEIFYFRNRDVTLNLPGSPVETASASPVVVELGSELTQHIAVDTGVQWDPHSNAFVRGKTMVHFMNEADQIINLGYLYRHDPLVTDKSNDITQTDMSFRWPVYNNWYAVGRWQYSWLYNRTQDGFFGLEKENCCWRFRIIGRSYLNSINKSVNNISQVVEGTNQTGIFFQVELKGLTGIGAQLDDFFATSIYGYRKPAK
ncbi:MAG: LPS assembly protein LptD [Methylovulum sp.]|nr:LPS assembly protein LptD [Methylovulum sp.]